MIVFISFSYGLWQFVLMRIWLRFDICLCNDECVTEGLCVCARGGLSGGRWKIDIGARMSLRKRF